MSNDTLKDKLDHHLLSINNDIKTSEAKKLWQDIAIRYSESARAYHTLVHLRQLFEQFEQVELNLKQPHIVALALFYHDVIYEPKRADNELKSAEYAQKVLSKYLIASQIERIYSLIMMTAKHQLKDRTDLDAAYLLDMDLSMLGATWSEYDHYAKAVRQEYSHVPLADYRQGRTEVLQGLLDHPRIYLTDHYYQRLETQARKNIEREITALAV